MPSSSFPVSVEMSSGQLRDIRTALLLGATAIERRLSPPSDEAVDTAASSAAHLACLTPVLDGLEASGHLRILRRLVPDRLDPEAVARGPGIEVGVIVDVETTGLDHHRDEVIELGLVRFEHVEGQVLRVTGAFGALREPGVPIGPKISRLTGITPGMVAGRAIDLDAVADMLTGVDLVIAHNAAFDRPFCEALHPAFSHLSWACSVDEVDWAAAGFDGARLGHLLLQAGWFHDGHRALDDCHALLQLLRLMRTDGGSGGDMSLLSGLAASAAETRRRVWADGAPFERKDLLKARGYRWFPGSSTARKAWWRDVPEDQVRDEVLFLRDAVYGFPAPLRTERLTARDRYRAR